MYIIIMLLALAPAHAHPSARRDPGVSFNRYLEEARDSSRVANPRFGKLSRASAAADQAVPWTGTLSLRAPPEWENETLLRLRFARMRDARVLRGSDPQFPRRATWLYPDDGCYARAALGLQILSATEPGVKLPGKIFAFGNLRVATPNAPSGIATWWYHVAPIVRVGSTNYVLDPSIDPRGPMPVNAWIASQTETPESVQVAVCGGGTYAPTDRCDLTTPPVEPSATADAEKLLGAEWSRLLELGRDPARELGDRPPWH